VEKLDVECGEAHLQRYPDIVSARSAAQLSSSNIRLSGGYFVHFLRRNLQKSAAPDERDAPGLPKTPPWSQFTH